MIAPSSLHLIYAKINDLVGASIRKLSASMSRLMLWDMQARQLDEYDDMTPQAENL